MSTRQPAQLDRPLETWLRPDEQPAVEYADYWNDERLERDKPWDVLEGDFPRMEAYLLSVGLPQDLGHALEAVRGRRGRGLSGQGIDLAAGNLWAAPYLLRAGAERLLALEFSRHRLMVLGPVVLDHYGVPRDDVVLVWGSFYELKLPEASLDFVFLSQAFHHAARPGELLEEIRRVLRPGGVAIIIGEHVVRARAYAAHYAKLVASALPRPMRERLMRSAAPVRRTLRPAPAELYPTDEAGDHIYTRTDYRDMFDSHGYSWQRLRRRGSLYQGYLLFPRS